MSVMQFLVGRDQSYTPYSAVQFEEVLANEEMQQGDEGERDPYFVSAPQEEMCRRAADINQAEFLARKMEEQFGTTKLPSTYGYSPLSICPV
jgi:hypothetical protein